MFSLIKTFQCKALLSVILLLSAYYVAGGKPILRTIKGKGRQTLQAEQKKPAYCIAILAQIADHVLNASTKIKMPVEAQPGDVNDHEKYTYLRVLGHLIAGMSPWFKQGPHVKDEGQLRKKYINLALACIKKAVDPKSHDFMNLDKEGQPLVNAAFFAKALIWVPRQLWDHQDAETKSQLIAALKYTHVITPGYNNWLIFSATVKAALQKFDGNCDYTRIDYALRQLILWHKEDGLYDDGPHLHSNYCNSFVIPSMMLDVLSTLISHEYPLKKEYETVLERAQRYAVIQKRLILPVAIYPLIGRSLAYRLGAFQVLSQLTVMKELPTSLSGGKVRHALYSVIKDQMSAAGAFDKNDWLEIGVWGHQSEIATGYISTGSLYPCSVGMFMLGSPPNDPFWNAPDKNWTEKKPWAGKEIPIDHAINN